jgi:hypothetical protein
MRDIPAIPTRISDALHGGASLDSTAGRSGQRTGKSPESLDCPGREPESATDATRRLAARVGRYAGQCIHGPNSSWTATLIFLQVRGGMKDNDD